jgi:cell shape-determining protein MreD
MSPFQQFKIYLTQLAGLPKDALHIYVGLIVFFTAAIVLRAPLKSWKPIAAVILAAIAGEVWDVIDTLNIGGRPVWARNWHDIWNTSFWPAVLFLLARYTSVLKR